jgi:hypothetical protein
MTVEELKAEIRNNPDGNLMMAYRIGYSDGLKDKSIELSKSIENMKFKNGISNYEPIYVVTTEMKNGLLK